MFFCLQILYTVTLGRYIGKAHKFVAIFPFLKVFGRLVMYKLCSRVDNEITKRFVISRVDDFRSFSAAVKPWWSNVRFFKSTCFYTGGLLTNMLRPTFAVFFICPRRAVLVPVTHRIWVNAFSIATVPALVWTGLYGEQSKKLPLDDKCLS